MITPLPRVLLRIFAGGFYKMHAGLLLGTFLGGTMYLFFINVLNETHITVAERIRFRLIFVLTLINSPLIAGLVAIAWIMYMLKSWKYITTQLTLPQHQFLRYSTTAINLGQQRISWALVQTIIMLPPLAFGVFALVNGIIFHYPLTIPFALLAITILLIAASGYRHVYLLNSLTGTNNNYRLARLMRAWPKPHYTLFIYHLVNQEKSALIITKLLSAALIVAGTHLFTDDAHDMRTVCLITIGIPLTHCVLLYRAYRFENQYLSFIRNFPYSKLNRYLALIAGYIIITLPESIWVVLLNTTIAPMLLLINISLGITIRCIPYRTGFDMQRFLTYTFLLFILLFIGTLFNTQWIFIAICYLLSSIIFYGYYDKQDQYLSFSSRSL